MIENKLNYQCLFIIFIGILSFIFIQNQPSKTSMYIINFENWFSSERINGYPPSNINSCTVILAAKLVGQGHPIIDRLAALSGARHLFINYFLNETFYGIIEGGFIQTAFGYRGISTTRIKPYAWDHGGYQWKVPLNQCEKFIYCLHRKTVEYHNFSLPYHFLFGPNSNSFIWWIFNQCSVKITPIFTKYPFVGIDYFSSNYSSQEKNHDSHSLI